ncbi:hypothetical protein [Nesterenkonia pannonica]|uniref:hypothetical protein n=1 Tax=Nesterenkonia pannonica TaxID=1548602 RepID=UPI00216431EC|nr:hypothetical protein [Nesterenkonia pannonica]
MGEPERSHCSHGGREENRVEQEEVGRQRKSHQTILPQGAATNMTNITLLRLSA